MIGTLIKIFYNFRVRPFIFRVIVVRFERFLNRFEHDLGTIKQVNV